MANLSLLFLLIALQYTVVYTHQTCDTVNGLDGCACRVSDSKEVVSLQALSRNSTFTDRKRFVTSDEGNWKFGFNPCGTFDMFLNIKNPPIGYKSCKEATAARYTSSSTKICDKLGNLNGAKFDVHKTITDDLIVSNLTVTYRNMDSVGKQGAVISLICNSTLPLDESDFKYINVTEGVQETYYFSLESKCCCPGGCYTDIPKPSTSTMLSPGVLQMLFLVSMLFAMFMKQ